MLTTVPFKSAPGLDTPVSEVMHHGLIALPATATLADAASTMRDNNVHAVLITGTDGSPLGWVTSRGILHNHARDWTVGASAADAITQPAADALTRMWLAPVATKTVIASARVAVGATLAAGAPSGVLADSDLVAFMAR